jgi:molybdopterin molybdotransferase
MRTVTDHQLAIAKLLAPFAAREPERWRGFPPPVSPQPRVLAADIVTPIDLPPFDNSQMDGYAVRSAEVFAGASFAVASRVAAGSPASSLAPGGAAPIMTGAPIPTGADAVIPIEASTPDRFQPEDGSRRVSFDEPAAAGTFVRTRGSDLAAGQLLLPAGTRLGAAQWGVLAASGVTEVALVRPLRVFVLSTGDELAAAGSLLEPGKIYDANSVSMAVALAGAGAVVSDVLVVPDDADRLRELLGQRLGSADLSSADLILTTGGVSKGAYEVVRDVFEGAGVEFVSVAMQPGGPQGFGAARLGGRSIPVVAFPGNPVSALVSFEMFLRPALRELHGLVPDRPHETRPLAEALDSPEGKHQVRRGRLNSAGEVELVGGPSSHLLHSYAASTLLVHVPLGVSHLDAHDPITVWSIDD